MHSIKQNPSTPNLPNLTQLGVLFRIGGLTVFAAALHGLLLAEDLPDFVLRMSLMIAVLAPILLTVLLGLYFAYSRLAACRGVVARLLIIAWVECCTLLWLWINHQTGRELQKASLLALIWTLLLYYYFHLRSMALSPAITEARLQALQARIRPHFLFNSLNAVLGLIRVDPRRAEHVLENFAELFRVQMADNRQLVPLHKELSLARQYLEIEQVRLGDRLQLEWHVSKMPADAMIPPLVLQPLLENAVYHGVERSVGAGTIAINIYHKGHEVFIQIRNSHDQQHEAPNGHAGNKMALVNIRERLMLHFDLEAELTAQPGHDYYQVMIRMPYQKEAK